MAERRIRALAICVFSHEGRILASEAHDPMKGLTFCRPLGGGIEFGETAEAAVRREIMEEIGVRVASLRYIGTLENIFTYLGEPGHEIVMVFDGELEDAAIRERGWIEGAESDGERFVARWRRLGEFGPHLPLYPQGLAELLAS